MQLEFHQLERRGEHLRVQHPQQQKRLLASLASSDQQTPIVVVPLENQPYRYVVIDGDKRVAALQQLGRDTVEAVIWPMTEAEALVLNRSSRWSQQESALEQGWLLADLHQGFEKKSKTQVFLGEASESRREPSLDQCLFLSSAI
jgi:ParB family transcriptional regulator, chromosome partitioning protein